MKIWLLFPIIWLGWYIPWKFLFVWSCEDKSPGNSESAIAIGAVFALTTMYFLVK